MKTNTHVITSVNATRIRLDSITHANISGSIHYAIKENSKHLVK